MTRIALKPDWNEIMPDELSHDELLACLAEADKRGLTVPHPDVERAYEALLEGRAELAGRLMSRLLFPNGGDSIAARIEARKAEGKRKAA
ncbi:MAG: hypothetical protein SV862_00295 [Pseudomonadota bacterium]|nr:hypothetical protein [Pseudomonadota bacterium]